ncbi:Coenzyme F420 hydrogenase/dehydrogenase, beta subunit C-terminal domain [Clostridium algidicarnis]|uniref:Coenzyme F420 hydrogenase/dehydrogenase, beta subunit C-terminal domain n=1 Tax=Clostridium algidicarnis TaxID=37659 RepID=UPI003FD6D937
MSNINIFEKVQCFGCSACSNICPVNSINMELDSEGFLYPIVDIDKCIQCGKCIKHCPISNDVVNKNVISSFGLIHHSKNITDSSASGGAFTAIAETIFEEKGKVYGCAFNEKIEAKTISTSSPEELIKLRGSKYVQCDNNNQYEKIKNDLDGGKHVLYVSTPCFIAGLKSYLKSEYKNLFLVDIFCHGVPSPRLFETYINWLGNKHNGKVEEYSFRDKKYGWGTQGHYIVNGKKHVLYGTDPYYNSFLSGKTYRPSCYECKYASGKRPGDISIGDFWGIEKYHPEVVTSQGVSAVLINNEKGKGIFSKFDDKIFILETELVKVSDINKQLIHPTFRPEVRDEIYEKFNSMNFNKFVNKYLYSEPIALIKIKRMIPQRLKKLIRKIIKI